MNYKFQVGDLVRIKPGLPESGSIVLVIGRRHTPFQMDEVYTLLLNGGERVDSFPNRLRKVNK